MNAAAMPPEACVLVVDDTPANLAVAVDHLEARGLRVLVAQDGEEGLERARFASPDLILLDVMMPGIDGFETCRRLKADPTTRDIPVIFMTALAATTEKLAGFDVGGVDYLTKPFSAAELFARIGVHLALRHAQAELTRQNQMLLHEVSERGRAQAELQGAYDELKRATARLEDTRGQLLQSEKLAAVGVLAAGVAHELNNPVGFVASNLSTLDGYLADVLRLVERYEAAEGVLATAAPDVLAAIRQARAEMDFEFIRDDTVKLIAESRDGLQRVSRIVDNLCRFAQADAPGWQLADLNACIDGTLELLAGELGERIEVTRDYACLPLVECRPAALNQVFMNVLLNAVQAIPERGRIRICSGAEGGRVWIEFADTGVGIAAENLPRIFDPFFTTRPVGSGTGLGLYVAYLTMKQHHGEMEVHSTVGQGSTLRLNLPVKQPAGGDKTDQP